MIEIKPEFTKGRENCSWFTSSDKVVSTRQLVSILCLLYFKEITDRELDFLCECINVGGEVNKEAKESFQINYKTSKENTAQILMRLAAKEILIPIPNKEIGKRLHPLFDKVLQITQGKINRSLIITYGVQI